MCELMEVCAFCDGTGLERAGERPCWHCQGLGWTHAEPVDAHLCECPECLGATMYEGGPSGFDYPVRMSHVDGSIDYEFQVCRHCDGEGVVWFDTEPITPDDFEEAYGVAA